MQKLSRRLLLTCIPGAAALAAGLIGLPPSVRSHPKIEWTRFRIGDEMVSRDEIARLYGQRFADELDRVIQEYA